jgi:radical SAM protein with 4Fe4S-binding SPASM domain
MSLSLAPWVSSRTYFSTDKVCSVIINERSRRFYTLEDESADLWSKIENGATKELLQNRAIELDVASELDEFLVSLEEMDLFINVNSTSSPAPYFVNHQSSNDSEAESSFQQLESEFSDWVRENGGLWALFYEMTYRCNERCVHCFNPGAAHTEQQKPQRNTEELTTEEAIAMIDDAYVAGAFKVCLSGGEVLIRKDFFEIVAHIRSKRMTLTIYTNGLLLDEDALKRLANFYPAMVGMSVYSAVPEIHDATTKVKGSHERTIAALRQLNELGLRTVVKATMMDHAVQGWQLLKQLADDIGSFFQMDMQITAGNDGAREPMSLNVNSYAELIALALTENSSIYVDPTKNFSRINKSKDQPVCGAGRSTLSVNPEGDVYTCVAFSMTIANTRNQSISSQWRSSRYGQEKSEPDSRLSRWQNIKLKDYHECGTHERCQWCNKCPGMSFAESGDPLAASEVQCRIAAARMDAAQRLEAGETRAAILESLGLPENFGMSHDIRPLVSKPVTATIDPREIGGRRFDTRKVSL